MDSGPKPELNRRGDPVLSNAQLVKLGRMNQAAADHLCLLTQQFGHDGHDPSMEVLMRIPRSPLYCDAKLLCFDLVMAMGTLESLVKHLRKREFTIHTSRKGGQLWRLEIQTEGWLCATTQSESYWRSVYGKNPVGTRFVAGDEG